MDNSGILMKVMCFAVIVSCQMSLFSALFAQQLTTPGAPKINLIEEVPEQAVIETQRKRHSSHVGADSGGWSLNNTTIGYANRRMAVPFVMRGNRVDALRLYHIYRAEGYGSGNGGTLKYQIYADVNGEPGGEVLGESDDIFGATAINKPIGWSSLEDAKNSYPYAVWNPSNENGKRLTNFRKVPFKKPVYLEDGGHYWYVVINTSADPSNNYVSINNVISTSNIYHSDQWFTHPASSVHVERKGEWIDKGDIPIYEFYGETTFGRTWLEEPYPDGKDRGYALTSSSDRIRESFELTQTDTFYDVSLFAGRESGNGKVKYELKDNQGVVLRSGLFSDFPSVSSSGSGDSLRKSMAWKTAIFSSPVVLEEGVRYSIELSSSSKHWISSFRDGAKSGFFEGGVNSYSGFREGKMEISDNSGESWFNPKQWGSGQQYMDVEMFIRRVVQ